MKTFYSKAIGFLKSEAVLCAAVILAAVSAFFVPPNKEYVEYIDWSTLALLFSLMAVMSGFQKIGAFDYLGNAFLKKISTSRQLLFALVFLPFVLSMFITNDVSLITFVPFGIIVLSMAKEEELLVPLVVLQTVSANLGSMLTPMGNPQNLYLYSKSGLGFLGFIKITLPYIAVSAVCLAVLILFRKNSPVNCQPVDVQIKDKASVFIYLLGFVLALLSIAEVISPFITAAIIFAVILIKDRKVLLRVDYSLLLTFIAFFIFIGNMGKIEGFRNMIESVLEGREIIVSAVISQVISNVPAALLLSGFTDNWRALIVGCNIGGLGTLIASMASLISYKQISKAYPEKRKKYFTSFTLLNIVLLVLLLLFSNFYEALI